MTAELLMKPDTANTQMSSELRESDRIQQVRRTDLPKGSPTSGCWQYLSDPDHKDNPSTHANK